MLRAYLHLTVITYITLVSIVTDISSQFIRLIKCELIFVALVADVAFVADVAIVSTLCEVSDICSVRSSGLVRVEGHGPAPGATARGRLYYTTSLTR